MRDVIALFICVAAVVVSTSMGTAGNAAYLAEVEEWHKGRIARLTSDTGYLSLVGLFEISEGENTFGAAEDNDFVFPDKAPEYAGKIIRDGWFLEIDAREDAGISHDGEPVDRMKMITDVEENTTTFELGPLVFYAIERGGKLYLRVKDRENVDIRLFKGIERYPVDEKWRIPAVYERYPEPVKIYVPDVLGYDRETQCEGEFVFDYEGETYRLQSLGKYGDKHFVVFGDATSGDETYGGGRFVYVPEGDAGGTFIDFNKAYNPPCAFNEFATCPLPHEANRLPFPIRAGEKNYVDAHH